MLASCLKSMVIAAIIFSFPVSPLRAKAGQVKEIIIPKGLEVVVELTEGISSKTHFAGEYTRLPEV